MYCITVLHSHHTVKPDRPQNLSVKFDNSDESLNITVMWEPPRNSRQFDLDYYTVNVMSNSSIYKSRQVLGSTATWQFTDPKMQRADFNVRVTATNKCGQIGSTASETKEYIPSKHYTCNYSNTTVDPIFCNPKAVALNTFSESN